MSTNIVVALDTRRVRADGTFPLILRLGHQRRTAVISLDLYLPAKDWDDMKRLIKNSYHHPTENATRLNNGIASRRTKAINLIDKLDAAQKLTRMSVTDVKAFIEKYIDSGIDDPLEEERKKEAQHSTNFFTYADKSIKALAEAKRFGTRDSYLDAVAVLEKFHGSRELDFKVLNYEFLRRLETAHYAKGNTANGLAAYLRSVRAIFNSAIKAEIIEEKYYPFRKYQIKTVPTKKLALPFEQLQKIITKNLATDHPLFNARNYFVAGYMMYGMSFMDLAFLKKTDITNGRVDYRRTKTSKLYDIKITPAVQEILSFYVAKNTNSPFVFPILKRETPEMQHRDVEWARKRYNTQLRELAEELEVIGYLSTKVVRHSFATQALLNDVPINIIKTMLGHSSVKTTEIYLASLPSELLDNYNERIMQKSVFS